jgi:nicotinamide-nucleotide amidase
MADAGVFRGRAAVRAGILVTGTEVLTGIIQDRNGPWLSQRLLELGVDPAMIEIVGDRPDDLIAALQQMVSGGMQLIVTSGGLGPTADDLTAQLVGEFCGREMVLDAELEARIAEIIKPSLARWPDADHEALRAANRKQALIPEGSTVLSPQGTAPGLVVTPAGADVPTVVVLPGPPRELQPMWLDAIATHQFKRATAAALVRTTEIVRLFGMPEAEIANTLREADAAGLNLRPLEITTCLRRGEIEVATRFEPQAQSDYEALIAFIAERHAGKLFSRDGSTIDQQVAELLISGDDTIGLAESCTGGLLAGRLTERPGSSAYVIGGAVVYSDQAKSDLVGVEPGLIAEYGAVSIEVAEALATGARRRFGASVGVGITGVAGPGGGTPRKPVGYVCFAVSYGTAHAETELRSITRATHLHGDRAAIRERSTTVAMHLIADVLKGRSD